MIDVPVRVKDALRSGDYRKNYEIHVGHYHDPYYKIKEYFTVQYDEDGWSVAYNVVFNTGGKYRLMGYQGFQEFKMIHGSTEETAEVIHSELRAYVDVNLLANVQYTLYFRWVTLGASDRIYYGPWTEYEYIEDFIIDNSHLVAESVKFDERMCSDTELKFGLCEGTSVEFQYFDCENIRNRPLKIMLQVEYKDESGDLEWSSIPMGFYEVEECSRQASTGIIKAVAYNKLKSRYLDQKINADLIALLNDTPSHILPLYKITELLLKGYSVEKPVGKKSILKYTSYYGSPPDGGNVHIYGVSQTNQSGQRDYNGHRWCVEEYIALFPDIYDHYYDPALFYQFIVDTTIDECSLLFSEYLSRAETSVLWCEEESRQMSVREYIAENYEYSKHFGGYLEIKTNNETIEIPLYENNYGDTGFINGILAHSYTTYSVAIHVPTNIVDITLTGQEYYDDVVHHTAPSNMFLNDYSMWYVYSRQAETTQRGEKDVMPRMVYNDVFQAYLQTTESDADLVGISLSLIEGISDDITLRELQSAAFELNCQYGKLDRVTDLFAGIELNEGALYPRDNLYPANNLLPMGTSESGYPAMYSKLWADEGNVRTFRYLIITYKAMEDGQEVEKKLQRTVNTHGTDDYNMSDNWLFRNLVWTAEQVGAYADAMVAKMRGISWFPFEMWCAGLPFLEAGDEIEIQMREGTYKSYVLRRTLSGIQNLQDEMINGTLDIF